MHNCVTEMKHILSLENLTLNLAQRIHILIDMKRVERMQVREERLTIINDTTATH